MNWLTRWSQNRCQLHFLFLLCWDLFGVTLPFLSFSKQTISHQMYPWINRYIFLIHKIVVPCVHYRNWKFDSNVTCSYIVTSREFDMCNLYYEFWCSFLTPPCTVTIYAIYLYILCMYLCVYIHCKNWGLSSIRLTVNICIDII